MGREGGRGGGTEDVDLLLEKIEGRGNMLVALKIQQPKLRVEDLSDANQRAEETVGQEEF